MRKLFAIFISIIVISMALQQSVFAKTFNALSIRLEQPKTPTNQQEFDIVFVTLDVLGRDVTVTCNKKGPYDADFVQFGGAQTFTGGGNTGVCPITSSILNTKGDYSFKVIATAGSDTKSDTVSMTFNSEGPGDPTGYVKERANLCDYKIKFHSADDSGKTIKVEVYRSENKSFTADSGSRVDTITIGSNTDGQSITTPPDCNKEYYFGIRAFDSAGNGSNIVGDSETKITTTTTTTSTTTSPTQGAVALGTPGEGSVLGNGEAATEEGKVLGEETPSTEKSRTTLREFLKNNGILVFGIILLIIGIIGLYVSKKKKI
ncbi:MAG: hypothetical protein V1917_02890 [Candidatus Gottesmanbacteria bacterium]